MQVLVREMLKLAHGGRRRALVMLNDRFGYLLTQGADADDDEASEPARA